MLAVLFAVYLVSSEPLPVIWKAVDNKTVKEECLGRTTYKNSCTRLVTTFDKDGKNPIRACYIYSIYEEKKALDKLRRGLREMCRLKYKSL